MAGIQLKPPEPFDFKHPDGWLKWRRRFEQYRVASGLGSESSNRQVCTLTYCMGEEADGILSSTNITAEDRKNYDKVLESFDAFFLVRRNTILERAKFNRRNQREGESAEEYITALYDLIETCDYGTMRDELLRDRIVVGITDSALSERLQLDSKLTLEGAKKAVRQREAVREQQRELQKEGSSARPIVIDEVKSGRQHHHRGGASGRSSAKMSRGAAHQSTQGGCKAKQLCKRCGKDHSQGARCPAKGAVCNNCKRKGHFASQCFSKSICSTAQDQTTDSAFLGALHSKSSASQWCIQIQLEGQEIQAKLDTGAEISAISEDTYRTLKGVKLRKPTKVLYGPTHQSLKVIGEFEGTFTKNCRSSQQTIFVIHGLRCNLLGLPAITALNLVAKVDAVMKPDDIVKSYPSLFHGLGKFGKEYSIELKDGAKPHALFTPRNVPIPLRSKVKQELDRMESLGVITKINTPTQWCAGMVVVPKRSGAVRICVDFKVLNESVMRETHPIPSVDDTLAQLSGATVFSKVDANSGFWQIPLAKQSRHLTTFITPFGRYSFNKLPFGISSAPELFQREMNHILAGLDGVLCHMDDVLIFAKDKTEHDSCLKAALSRLQAAGVTLNKDKCEFNKESIRFLGHLVDKSGIRADPDKTSAIAKLQAPSNVSELRRIMGMVNQLGKFSPNIAEIGQPLRELLSAKAQWIWGPEQDKAFATIKDELTRPTVLAQYNPTIPTKVSADASSYGLGAVLLQQSASTWKPVAFASRSMTTTERRYAQIEKEALAVTWACGKFSNYVLGRTFEIETDHKPLVPLLSTKHLNDLPPRILRFRLRMARFNYTIHHTPGKLLYIADTLSRAPIEGYPIELIEEAEFFVQEIVQNLPATKQRLCTYREAQLQDPICSQVIYYCQSQWPEKSKIGPELRSYWKARSSLSVHENLLLYNSRIVIPHSLQKDTLSKIHKGHQGIVRCRMRSKSAVWWPGISKQITEMIQNCHVCCRDTVQRKEPLMTTVLPDYPWQMIGTDLFEIKGVHYVLVVDYFSRFPEIMKLTSTTSSAVITSLKSIFSRHGLPEVVRSDNGPQFSSQEFAEFAREFNFHHVTSSPRYPQSNGLAERTVKTVKLMLKQADDPYISLLNYRSTPLPFCGYSPTELSMGRKVRNQLPQTDEHLIPQWSYLNSFRKADSTFKKQQKESHDRRHRVRELPPIPDNSEVWVRPGQEPVQGRVVTEAGTPRSYLVKTPTGTVRRNRVHLGTSPPQETISRPQAVDQPARRIMTRNQTGTAIIPPDRFGSYCQN